MGGRRWRAWSIPGTRHRDEYVMLSAHFDSWDGSSGATDNGTGTPRPVPF